MNRILQVATCLALLAGVSGAIFQPSAADESSANSSDQNKLEQKSQPTDPPKVTTEAKAADPVSINKTAVAKAGKVKEDLPNFHQVHPFLYRSGEPTEAGLRKLKEMGVKTVIDLRAPSEFPIDEPKIAKELGLKYVNLVMTSKAPTQKQIDTMMKEIKKAQDKPDDGSVLVHCAHGSDRTGCMIGIWRVTQEGWSYDDTYKEMRKYWFTPKFTNLSNAVKERASK